jgi:hypothetical protein
VLAITFAKWLMIPGEHRDNPDQINPIDQINQEEVQALRVHQVDQADLHHQKDRHLRVHQVDQADLHQIDPLLRVHQVDQADLVIQVVIEQEVRDPAEVEVHGLEKMNNATIAALN